MVIQNKTDIEIRKVNTGDIEISYRENTEKKSFYRCVIIPKNRFKDLIKAIKDKRF
jgi:DNA polymerase III sliding clamp (beta) subunit (PCNA family)